MSSAMLGQACVVGGVILMGLGVLTARRRLVRMNRAQRKRELIHPAMPEGWGGWFFQGFANVTMGTRWVVTMVWLFFCMIVGVGLISVGLQWTS